MPATETHIEASGDSVDAAIADALGRLSARREDVDVKVIDEGRKGFLGLFGNRPARVFVSLKKRKPAGAGPLRPSRREPSGEGPGRSNEPDLRAIATSSKDVMATILQKMGFVATVDTEVRNGQVAVIIDCPEREGLLIGRKGETLHALEHLVARIASRNLKERAEIAVDVSGYRTRRADTVVSRAVEMGQEVLRTGRELKTEPMVASDRRLVHRALAEIHGVETQAIGNGSQKRILIRPTGEGGAQVAQGGEEPASRASSEYGHGEGGGRGRGGYGGGGGRGERGERGGRGGRGRDRGERRGPRSDRGPRRFEDRGARAPSHEPATRGAGAGSDLDDRGTAEPLDLLGSLRGAMDAQAQSPPSTEHEDGADRIGARSRRRRPAKRRL